MPAHPRAVNTVCHIIPEIGSMRTLVVLLTPKPSYDELRGAVEPHLDGERVEHVAVLWDGLPRDMFVGECSSINGRMIRNVRATEIYRNNALTRWPKSAPESLPSISGPAVLFDRRVWF